MEVDLAAMTLTTSFKLVNTTINVCPGEWLSVSEQDVVISCEIWSESKFKCDAETFSSFLATAFIWYSLPPLRVDRHLTSLDGQEFLI